MSSGSSLLRYLVGAWWLGSWLLTSIQAAPCCAGGSSVPGLITGDDQFLLSAALSADRSDQVARDDGTRFRKSLGDGGEAMVIRGTGLIARDWQLGLELPFVRRSQDRRVGGVSTAGLGDMGLIAAYEWISDATYSAYRPKVYVFSRVLIPTGISSYQGLDAAGGLPTGKGFGEWGGGLLAVKNWGGWDLGFSAQANWVLPRRFTDDSGQVSDFASGSSYGASLAVGYLFRRAALRIGASVAFLDQSERDVVTEITGVLSSRSVWDCSLQAGIRWTDEWSTSLIYSDQTWLPAKGAELSRSISISVQRNILL